MSHCRKPNLNTIVFVCVAASALSVLWFMTMHLTPPEVVNRMARRLAVTSSSHSTAASATGARLAPLSLHASDPADSHGARGSHSHSHGHAGVGEDPHHVHDHAEHGAPEVHPDPRAQPAPDIAQPQQQEPESQPAPAAPAKAEQPGAKHEHGHEHGEQHDHSNPGAGAPGHTHTTTEFPQLKECTTLKNAHNIQPGVSWGNAPESARNRWAALFCDDPFLYGDSHSKRPYRPEGQAPSSGFGGRSQMTEVLDRDIDIKKRPQGTTWIVFLTPMTTSHITTGEQPKSHDDLVFFKELFPSFLEHSKRLLASEEDKYWYSFYVGFDVGDYILDNMDELNRMADHMNEQLAIHNIPQRKVGIRFFRLGDTVHAPSWAVDHLAQAAMDAKCDYIYQINDDVRMKTTNWEDTLIGQLKSSNNFGVTGPLDESNTRILTQSFVHRTHVEIFDTYFPPSFKNWFSDDWLSEVYGDRYLKRGHDVVVRHNVGQVGQRYPADQVGHMVQPEVDSGRQRIRAWLREHSREDISFR